MLKKGWVFVVVLLLLIDQSYSTQADRYMMWTKNDDTQHYKLQLCSSKGECNNLTWSFKESDPCVSNCSGGNTINLI